MKRNYTPKFWEWSQSQNRKGYINMKFKIVQGNIVDADVDAVVLPANSHLKEGHGASEAIFKAADEKN